jgi:hypothetical protein
MVLLNDPSITKEQYILTLKNKEKNLKDKYELDNINKQIQILQGMDLLLNPSPPSGKPISKSVSKTLNENLENKSVIIEKTDVVVKDETPIKLESIESISSFEITPNCSEGKIFDRIKKRCVKIKSLKKPISIVKTKKQKPCLEGQERNPETGRCVKIKTPIVKTKKQKPCLEGQERNPETGRCVKIKTPIVKTKKQKPCLEGQERNPETGRCVKIKIKHALTIK